MAEKKNEENLKNGYSNKTSELMAKFVSKKRKSFGFYGSA